MTKEDIKKILPTIPESPGCYLYFNKNGDIIYVGKAKNLRKRISSYFRTDIVNTKTKVLVRSICDLKYIIVNTEQEALLLENALIKEHQPRYNILLKDDKTYPSIVIKKEPFPRIFVTRNIIKDGSIYFGPYPNVAMAQATLEMIKEIYPIRTCKLDLSPDKISKGKYKECLQYHIKKCKAPCVSKQKEDDYLSNIIEITSLLKGNLHDVIELYEQEMLHLSKELRFEEAQTYKEKLEYLRKYEVKHTVAPNHINNVDIFSYEKDDNQAYINYMHIKQGMVNRAMTYEYKINTEESDDNIFSYAISDIRQKVNSQALEIIIPFNPGWLDKAITITIPQRGDKKKLLDLSLRNVKQYKVDKYKQAEKLNPDQRLMQIMKDLQSYLSLPKAPLHIECFDNSNIQGTAPVAACVVFKKGKPSKKDYRTYHIKTVIGTDDYESMREVTYRHYKNYIENNRSMPDLILADGGKGQINAIKDSLSKLGLGIIPIAGLAKNNRHQTNTIISGKSFQEIPIKYDSPTFKLLENIQREVHRFAITFHRNVRSNLLLSSQLDDIIGIGEKTKNDLLSHFKSIKGIQNATLEELSNIIGSSRASKVYIHFHGNMTT